MKINRGNYEVYFLDYYEHRLEPQQVAELMIFLQENPDLSENFESYDSIVLKPESVSFEMKKGLKRQNYKPVGTIDAYSYEQWMVDAVDGELSDEQLKNLDLFFEENPNARLEYALFRKTKLVPEPVIFESKKDLKKKNLYIAYKTRTIAAIAVAASIILLIGLYFGSVNQDQKRNQFKITSTEKIEIPNLNPGFTSPETILPRSSYVKPVGGDETPDVAIVENPHTEHLSLALMQINQRKIDHIFVSIQDMETNMGSRNRYTLFLAIAVKPDEDRPGFVGRFVQGLFRKAIPKLDQKSFLEYTLDGYNLMADRDVELEKEFDETGKVVAYRINGENIRIGQRAQAPLKE